MAGDGKGRGEEPRLSFENITKRFGKTLALDDVSFHVLPGEIVGLVGQNGSGKSTLIKILSGYHEADDGGRIMLAGRDMSLAAQRRESPSMSFIHQESGLVGNLTAVENFCLHRGKGVKGLAPFNEKSERAELGDLLETFQAGFDVSKPVSDLTPAERAIVAITRAFGADAGTQSVLVLDEPTASLHADEVETLFRAIRQAAASGSSVIIVSHRLKEVEEIADRVVVLRDGRVVANVVRDEYSTRDLVEYITGGSLAERNRTRSTGEALPLLDVEGLRGERVASATFSVGAGEIVGIFGLLGSGVENVGSLVFGSLERLAGEVRQDGETILGGSTTESVRRGIGFVPADRAGKGGVMSMTVRENLTLPDMTRFVNRLGWLRRRHESAETSEWLNRLDVRPSDPEQELGVLSGGNQQKVVLARWLRLSPTLLLLDEPTHGVDVGAKASIHDLIVESARSGMAVLISSTDTDELVGVCDRVLVMVDGQIADEIGGSNLTEDRLVASAQGIPDGHP